MIGTVKVLIFVGHNLSCSTTCSDLWVLEFVISNITGNNRWENCISLDFNFCGLSEPRNPQKFKALRLLLISQYLIKKKTIYPKTRGAPTLEEALTQRKNLEEVAYLVISETISTERTNTWWAAWTRPSLHTVTLYIKYQYSY